MPLESVVQKRVIREINAMYPNAFVIKTDPTYINSFPDLLVLEGTNWASLETKREPNSPRQPNQDYYIRMLNHMSFASFIDATNYKEVLHAMARSFSY